MFFDSHAHLDDTRFAEDLEGVLGRAREAGVTRIATISQDKATSDSAIAIARKYAGFVHAVIGIHPHEARHYRPEDHEWLLAMCRRPEVVAIGETGLDYHYDLSPRDSQKVCFEAQLQLAKETGLPIVLHSREAWDDCFSILDMHRNIHGVAHCFGGGIEEAQRLLNLGFLISFSGNITYPKSQVLRDVAAMLPLEKVLIETDCPYLSPKEWRGKRNEPAYVTAVASQIAVLKGINAEEVAEATFHNACAFYGVPSGR